jgi:hypothetical protein
LDFLLGKIVCKEGEEIHRMPKPTKNLKPHITDISSFPKDFGKKVKPPRVDVLMPHAHAEDRRSGGVSAADGFICGQVQRGEDEMDSGRDYIVWISRGAQTIRTYQSRKVFWLFG